MTTAGLACSEIGAFGLKQSQSANSSMVSPNKVRSPAGVKRLGARMLGRVLQILLEILKGKPCRIDKAAHKGFSHERFKIDDPKPGDRIEPAMPDETHFFGLKARVAIAQELRGLRLRQVTRASALQWPGTCQNECIRQRPDRERFHTADWDRRRRLRPSRGGTSPFWHHRGSARARRRAGEGISPSADKPTFRAIRRADER